MDLVQLGKQPLIEGCIHDQTVFQHLAHSRIKLSVIQCGKGIRIDIHEFRHLECADHIFVLQEIHAGLTADGGIHLRQQGSRDLDHVDTTHKDRCTETSHISYHTTTQCDHQVVTVHLIIHHIRQDRLYGIHIFVLLSGVEGINKNIAEDVFDRIFDRIGIDRSYQFICYDRGFYAFVAECFQFLRKLRKIIFDQNIVDRFTVHIDSDQF